MRVIAGSARSIQLRTVEGRDVRPTTDRIKETLFNMIAPEIYGCSFLDLFAGSGAIGIEALSRGAKEAYFVDRSRKSADCIRGNLQKTRLEDRAHLMIMDCMTAIRKLNGSGQHFDIIFLDPPYRREFEKQTIELLSGTSCIDSSTLIIAEASLDTDFGWLGQCGYRMEKNKEYKTNKHVFIRCLK